MTRIGGLVPTSLLPQNVKDAKLVKHVTYDNKPKIEKWSQKGANPVPKHLPKAIFSNITPSALRTAVTLNKLGTVKLLKQLHPNIVTADQQANYPGASPLGLSLNSTMAKELVSAGARLPEREIAQFLSSRYDDKQTLYGLETLRLDPNATDEQGNTALVRHMQPNIGTQAEMRTDTFISEALALLKAGANPNAQDKNTGQHVLFSPALLESDEIKTFQLMSLFLKKGGDINARSHDGQGVNLLEHYLDTRLNTNSDIKETDIAKAQFMMLAGASTKPEHQERLPALPLIFLGGDPQDFVSHWAQHNNVNGQSLWQALQNIMYQEKSTEYDRDVTQQFLQANLGQILGQNILTLPESTLIPMEKAVETGDAKMLKVALAKTLNIPKKQRDKQLQFVDENMPAWKNHLLMAQQSSAERTQGTRLNARLQRLLSYQRPEIVVRTTGYLANDILNWGDLPTLQANQPPYEYLLSQRQYGSAVEYTQQIAKDIGSTDDEIEELETALMEGNSKRRGNINANQYWSQLIDSVGFSETTLPGLKHAIESYVTHMVLPPVIEVHLHTSRLTDEQKRDLDLNRMQQQVLTQTTKSLFKDSNLADIVKLSKYWHKADFQNLLKKAKYLNDSRWEPIILPQTLPHSNNASVQALTTGRELREEGEIMSHCVGGNNFINLCHSGEGHILSVRDASGERISTVELKADYGNKAVSLLQNFGFDNNQPPPKITKAVKALVQKMNQQRNFVDYNNLEIKRDQRRNASGASLNEKAQKMLGFNPVNYEQRDNINKIFEEHVLKDGLQVAKQHHDHIKLVIIPQLVDTILGESMRNVGR